jgi:hypothetical protein
MNHDRTNAIRQAMSSEQFEAARHLWDEYAGSVRKAIENGTASPAMMSEMRDLVEWSRVVALSFRAHASDRLNQWHAAKVYGQPGC